MKSRSRGLFGSIVAIAVSGALCVSGVMPAVAGQQPSAIASQMPATAAPMSLTDVGPRLIFPGTPRTMVVTPDGRRGYVATIGNSSQVVVVDLQALSVVTSIPMPQGMGGFLGEGGLAMAPDGTRVYVAGVGANGVGAIDTARNSFAPIISVRAGHTVTNLAASPDGHELLAVTDGVEVSQYSLPSMTLLRTTPLGGETGAADVTFTPDSRTALIAATRPDSVLRLDLATGQLAQPIPVSRYAERVLATPDGKKAYAVCPEGSITVVDLAAGTASKTLSVAYRLSGAALARDGSRLLVSSYDFAPTVFELSTTTDSVATEIRMSGTPLVVATSPATNQAYSLSSVVGGTELDAITVSNGNPPTGIDRIFGADRFTTAVAIAQAGALGTKTVYVATGEDFADALTAAPAAAHEGAALLLTKNNTLPSVVKDEIAELKPRKIVVVGGPGAVSPAVFAELQALAPNTIRRSGPDRYATARAVVSGAFSTSTFVYLATGEDYPDALSAATVAGQNGAPVLLIRGRAKTIDAPTKALFVRLKTRNTPIVGGTAVVSKSIENNLAASLLNPERSAGADRFSTNRAVNQRYASGNRTYYVSGYAYPDALAMSAAAPLQNGIVYLVRSSCIPAGDQHDIAGTTAATRITLIGGPTIVNNAVAAGKTC